MVVGLSWACKSSSVDGLYWDRFEMSCRDVASKLNKILLLVSIFIQEIHVHILSRRSSSLAALCKTAA